MILVTFRQVGEADDLGQADMEQIPRLGDHISLEGGEWEVVDLVWALARREGQDTLDSHLEVWVQTRLTWPTPLGF